MIIDHNRSVAKSGSSSISTPNKSPSPLPHKPTPQQTAKSQQVHTHQSDESTADTTKIETTPSDPLLAMVHQSIHTSNDDASDITKVLSAKRSRQNQLTLITRGANTMSWLNGSLGRSLMNLWHSFPRMIQLLVQFMPRNMTSLTQQDGNTSKGMPKHPKDSSELSSNPGFAKLEHLLDTNMVSKSQRIIIMQ